MTKTQHSPENKENQDFLNGETPQTEGSVSIDSESNIPHKSRFFENPFFLRIGIYAITFIVIVLVIWGVGSLIVNGTMASAQEEAQAAIPTSKTEALPENVSTPVFSTDGRGGGVYRISEMHIENNADIDQRHEVIKYTVQTGDTIFGIAEKFGLKPETVLWANRYTYGDDFVGLSVGWELVILPVDGTYHKWSDGEGLNGIASFYGVSPNDIVNYPGNELDPQIVGDYSKPNIEPGTMLVVPDGVRPAAAWIIARDTPASGSAYLGPGACGGIIYGDVGTGNFTWPTASPWISGYEYTPPVHNGLDFGGRSGDPIYAADSGVIVYSGWSDRGYGNLIVVDHDRGFQTFYAHMLSGFLKPCGSSVQKGELIAYMGSTGNSSGPHLHFELRQNGYPLNPWQFLN